MLVNFLVDTDILLRHEYLLENHVVIDVLLSHHYILKCLVVANIALGYEWEIYVVWNLMEYIMNKSNKFTNCNLIFNRYVEND